MSLRASLLYHGSGLGIPHYRSRIRESTISCSTTRTPLPWIEVTLTVKEVRMGHPRKRSAPANYRAKYTDTALRLPRRATARRRQSAMPQTARGGASAGTSDRTDHLMAHYIDDFIWIGPTLAFGLLTLRVGFPEHDKQLSAAKQEMFRGFVQNIIDCLDEDERSGDGPPVV